MNYIGILGKHLFPDNPFLCHTYDCFDDMDYAAV